MATAVARAMPSEAPLPGLPTNDAPKIAAARIAATPTAVNATARRARMARTRALIGAPRKARATIACTVGVEQPDTELKKDLGAGLVTYRLTRMPRPNWTIRQSAPPI